ncbi:ACP S-malonyltransferase [Rhodococcus sp. 06-156-3C]|uniref:ACP S-malonyltransferase n=1 Tax=Nocardiaceae TaxID=85025 RepID=UPI00068F9557|nr:MULTISPECIES: ACP S-malonyltransferase [Rhodococcus]OZD18160.1 ACP S-malonyltransferase [Rhodococcus sp. 06-156-4C]OZD18757.1 ACP S-malonyltransferase [Rhodococcus sp. 06-156-3C]OZD22267.1 ACP S-malonyltransferase [Rhodococcus sp. 06-156-4a]OZD34073.1 ACP S-malonyltransferase [Rhodococcus sp. 06-156-3b]OZD38810.1 ACP S-malonyltransferase [Rhodococcus sp. 06-156-3]
MTTTFREDEDHTRSESPVARGAIFLCPGQGSQYPGLLDRWLATTRANEMCDRWSRAVGLDLRALSRDREALQDTAVVQPLVTAASLLAFEALSQRTWFDRAASCVLGHSVGELAAAAIAGFYSFDTAIRLASARGRYMSNCCTARSTGMLALMPSRRNPARPEEMLAIASASSDISIANINGSGQIVVAGELGALEAFELRLGTGVRAIYLDVAGAFHSPFMDNARTRFTEDLVPVAVTDAQPERPTLLSNRDGAVVRNGADLKDRLSTQIVSPVRWDLCMSTASTSYPDIPVIELAPGTSYGKLWTRQHDRSNDRLVLSLDEQFDEVFRGETR